jgi:hypothetical protein
VSYAADEDDESALLNDSPLGMTVLLNNTRKHRVKFNGDGEGLNDGTVDSFTAELSQLSVLDEASELGVTAAGSGTGVVAAEPAVSVMLLQEIERVMTRFCRHFVQAAPVVIHNAGAAPSATESGMGVRDELFASFGLGPDQWAQINLGNTLNGQQASVFTTVTLSLNRVLPDEGSAALDLAQCGAYSVLQRSVCAAHLFQYLCFHGSTGKAGRDMCANAATLIGKICQSIAFHTAKNPTSSEKNRDSTSEQHLLWCLCELFCLPAPPLYPAPVAALPEVPHGSAYLEHLSVRLDPRQQELRQRVYLDLHMHCFRSLQVRCVHTCVLFISTLQRNCAQASNQFAPLKNE